MCLSFISKPFATADCVRVKICHYLLFKYALLFWISSNPQVSRRGTIVGLPCAQTKLKSQLESSEITFMHFFSDNTSPNMIAYRQAWDARIRLIKSGLATIASSVRQLRVVTKSKKSFKRWVPVQPPWITQHFKP